MKTELKIMYKNIEEEKSKVILRWYGQELTITCEHIEIRDLETDKKMSTKENYKALFNHSFKILDELLDMIDIDLFKAWEIFYNQESFAYVENWEDWENVQSIEELDLNIKKYDSTKEVLGKYETTPLNNNMIN